MTDKEQIKIKEEIEKRVQSMNSCPFKTAELGSEKFNEGELHAYKQILQFIDSIPEEPNVKNENPSDGCPCCGWSLDSDGCCGSCGYGRK